MLLFVLAALMTLAVAWVLLRPLRRSMAPPAPADSFNLSVYRDQLADLDRDVARGAITEEEAAGARTEIERRVLAAGAAMSDGERRDVNAPRWAAPFVAAALVLGAGGAYLTIGKPNDPDRPFAIRTDVDRAVTGGDAMHAQMDGLIKKLSDKLAQNPDDAKGWALMARSLMSLERFGEAVDAYKRAMTLTQGADGALTAEYAEALVIANQGSVVPEARTLFERILGKEPKSPQARFYLALAKVQSGDTPQGLKEWKALLADSPTDAPWRETLERQIAMAEGKAPPAAPATTAPGPSAADVAAAGAMSEKDRAAMIEGMVAQLAARLEKTPGDVEGWRRLSRAYGVLGRTADAAKASERVLKLAPNDPDALWTLGAWARERGDAAAARRYWGQLLRGLPAQSPDRPQVQAAIAALPS